MLRKCIKCPFVHNTCHYTTNETYSIYVQEVYSSKMASARSLLISIGSGLYAVFKDVVFPVHTHLLFDVTTLVFVLRGYRIKFHVLAYNVIIITIIRICI